MTESPVETTLNEERFNKLTSIESQQYVIDKEPFRMLKINDASILNTIEGREICGQCFKSRKFFCYTCCKPVIDCKYFPRVKLPIKIDVIKHAREIDGKSTAIHAAILAPEDVTVYIYPDFPKFSSNDKVVLIFPSKNSVTIGEFLSLELQKNRNSNEHDMTFIKNNEFSITRAVFIDSTWNQTKSIYKDQRLKNLPCIVLKSRISQFWRHQKKSPRWYLATIEAIHQFLLELHDCIYGTVKNYALNETNIISTKLYCGQYDNLLYLFKYMYDKIHLIYDHNKLWAYKRPLI
ncbi:hypothetical protein PV325_002603 [Microctonus aethiopoides]|uniref:tRNA-uridine aminocarboxypropyltransferase 1 n=1 Tax=Microctonus aethiopoides TaxID=144406 RepID=A0AA39FKR2_9HYME|nr:hypothetical protein PV325_002603 [Microctonus aethiopoides]KAK0099159.1 hypothetical protein PV326_004318 [Microctonus aethiopoides]KAK0171405.1 hypothetical protein PV328_009141 [Microctonus aethiopoides]